MRRVSPILLAIVGVALVLASWGPLNNLLDRDRDGAVAVYLALGLPLLALGVVCLIVAWRDLTRP